MTLAVALLMIVALAASALAHVPPDTGLGDQDGCVSATHDVGDVIDGALDGNDCG